MPCLYKIADAGTADNVSVHFYKRPYNNIKTVFSAAAFQRFRFAAAQKSVSKILTNNQTTVVKAGQPIQEFIRRQGCKIFRKRYIN